MSPIRMWFINWLMKVGVPAGLMSLWHLNWDDERSPIWCHRLWDLGIDSRSQGSLRPICAPALLRLQISSLSISMLAQICLEDPTEGSSFAFAFYRVFPPYGWIDSLRSTFVLETLCYGVCVLVPGPWPPQNLESGLFSQFCSCPRSIATLTVMTQWHVIASSFYIGTHFTHLKLHCRTQICNLFSFSDLTFIYNILIIITY